MDYHFWVVATMKEGKLMVMLLIGEQDGKYRAILRKVQLPIIPRDRCQALFRKTRLGKFFLLHESFICAGGEPDKDACQVRLVFLVGCESLRVSCETD